MEKMTRQGEKQAGPSIPPMFHPDIVHIRGCGQVANITQRSSSEAQAGRDLPHKNSASMLNRWPLQASDDDDTRLKSDDM